MDLLVVIACFIDLEMADDILLESALTDHWNLVRGKENDEWIKADTSVRISSLWRRSHRIII